MATQFSCVHHHESSSVFVIYPAPHQKIKNRNCCALVPKYTHHLGEGRPGTSRLSEHTHTHTHTTQGVLGVLCWIISTSQRNCVRYVPPPPQSRQRHTHPDPLAARRLRMATRAPGVALPPLTSLRPIGLWIIHRPSLPLFRRLGALYLR
jgi:hypothetical protein